MGDVLRFSGQLFFRNQGSQVSLDDGDNPRVLFLRHGVAQMPEIKQASELAQQSNPELLIGDVRKCCEEFDVTNQMGQAELLQGTGVFDVGREEVADERALKGFAQDFLQDLGATGSIDGKKAEELGAEGPDPVAIAIVFMACFIDMKTGFVGQSAGHFLMGRSQCLTDGTNLIAEHRT